MKNLLFTVLAFGLLSSSAFAEEQPRPGLEKKQFTRVVASGTNTRIGFFTWTNPDCTAIGNVNVRVTKQPEHGTVETALQPISPATKNMSALSAMSTRLRECNSIISRREIHRR